MDISESVPGGQGYCGAEPPTTTQRGHITDTSQSLSETQILQQLRSGVISRKELCAACASRAKRVEELNAFITPTYDQAMKTAESHQGTAKLLDGIPFAVKDNFSTSGIETTCASKMLQEYGESWKSFQEEGWYNMKVVLAADLNQGGYVPPYTATVVQRLQDEGGLLCGKTNLDEFAMGSGCIDSVYGPSRNPWNYPFGSKSKVAEDSLGSGDQDVKAKDWFIAGGSSGGSAVAVACGAVLGALGSDTGGSTRLPASFCGVVGLKPSYGLLSRHGLIPMVNSLEVPGIFARTVDDAAILLSAMVGPDPKDATCICQSKELFTLPAETSVKGLTVGIPLEYSAPGMSEEVTSAWSLAADMIENAGASVKQVSLPQTQHSIACYSVLCAAEVASNMSRYDGIEYGLRKSVNTSTEALYADSRHAGFNDIVRGRIFAGNYFLLRRNYQEFFIHAQKVRRMIAEDFERVFQSGVDILLTPTTIRDAPSYAEFTSLDSRAQCEVLDVLTQPVNMAGIPAITIPVTLSTKGLPIGLQLIGQFFQDKKLLLAAKWLESQLQFPNHILLDELEKIDGS